VALTDRKPGYPAAPTTPPRMRAGWGRGGSWCMRRIRRWVAGA